MNQTEALELVYGALTAANELRAEADAIPLLPEVRLVGEGGLLDSLGLATLLMGIEARVEDASGQAINLLDAAVEDADGGFGPLETPARLAAFIVAQLD